MNEEYYMNFKKFLRNHRAFTLAEVVVVMAILSIMMVAFAPVVTKKTSSTGDTFRTFVRTPGNYGVYYGTTNDTKPVVIGATNTRSLAGDATPKLFLVATTDKSSDASAKLTPQIAFITGNKGNNLEWATGQLIVTGGLENESDIGQSATNNNLITNMLPSYLLMQPAFADVNTQYGDPSDKGISVILGGKVNGQYSYNVGKKQMTIVGGNACEGADIDGVTGLTCIGADAARGASTIDTNATIIGKDAAKSISNIPAGAVFIGYNAGSGISTVANGIYIGNTSESITADNIYFGNTTLAALINTALASAEHIQLAFDITANNGFIPSDERLKNVGKPFTAGLDEINKINPVNFTYKRDKNKFPHVGVIAQALSPIFPNAISINKDGYFYIRTEDMFYAAINAIKELYQMYLAHDKKIQQLEERSAALEQQNKELQVLYLDLAKRLDKLDKKKSKDIGFTQVPVFDEIEEPKSNVDAE